MLRFQLGLRNGLRTEKRIYPPNDNRRPSIDQIIGDRSRVWSNKESRLIAITAVSMSTRTRHSGRSGFNEVASIRNETRLDHAWSFRSHVTISLEDRRPHACPATATRVCVTGNKCVHARASSELDTRRVNTRLMVHQPRRDYVNAPAVNHGQYQGRRRCCGVVCDRCNSAELSNARTSRNANRCVRACARARMSRHFPCASRHRGHSSASRA